MRDANKESGDRVGSSGFCQQLETQDVTTIDAPPNQEQLEEWVRQGYACCCLSVHIALMVKEPHWIVLNGMSEKFSSSMIRMLKAREHAIASAFVPLGKRRCARF